MILRGASKTFLCLALCLGMLYSCEKEDVQPLNLISIEASGINLITTPTGVPVTSPITATFTTTIDPSSVSATSVSLTRNYDHADVPLTLIVSGSLLSIKSTADLISGADFTLTITSEIKSTHGDPFGSLTTTFRTAGVFVPENQVAYWNFENSPEDVVGNHDPLDADVVAIDYETSKNDSSGKAASFNGTTSLIQIAGGAVLLRPEFSISFWMKLNSDNPGSNGNQKGSFVIGIGNTNGLQFEVHPDYAWCRFSQGYLLGDLTTTMTNDFQFMANGLTKDNVQSSSDSLVAGGIDNATVLNQSFGSAGLKLKLANVWAQITMTFDDSTKTRTLYINGEKMYQQQLARLDNPQVLASLRPLATVSSLTFIPDGIIPPHYDDKLVFGFWQSRESTFGGEAGSYSNPDANHFKGLLDDVRFFNRALTDVEVSLIYEGEK